MTLRVVCFSINDNEAVAEMLIESMGANIINTSDSKGRWEKRAAPMRRTSDLYVVWTSLQPFLLHRRTPLHAAAFSDHVECVSLLLSHGAQANAVDTRLSRTPLMMAALNGQTNTVGQ